MPTDDKAERLKRKLEQYRGFVFRWQAYKELAPDWDHDRLQRLLGSICRAAGGVGRRCSHRRLGDSLVGKGYRDV